MGVTGTRRRLYLAGKVTGAGDRNRAAFESAMLRLEDAGYVAIPPHWFVPADAERDAAMRLAIETMLRCDGVALLDGWRESPGAVIEANLAADLHMPVRPVDAWERMARRGCAR